MTKLEVVVGGNYGSEGKGHIAAQRVLDGLLEGETVYNIRVGGPNAGHTAVTDSGEAVAFRHVPVGMLYGKPGAVAGMLAAGSEIDLDVLTDELMTLREARVRAGWNPEVKVWVDKNATLLEPEHIAMEQESDLNARTGSTAKGIGAARSERIWRRAKTIGQAGAEEQYQQAFTKLENLGMRISDTTEILQMLTAGDQAGTAGTRIVIEGTQGYELGLHSDHYPQVTSNDCRGVDFVSQAGISPWADGITETTVWVVARVYPIRVAGNSGNMAGQEVSWEELGLPAEKTTVTQKTRRVSTFDTSQLERALIGNGASMTGRNPSVKLALTMTDQVSPGIKGLGGTRSLDSLKQAQGGKELGNWIDNSLGEIAQRHLAAITTSPEHVVWIEEPRQPEQELQDALRGWVDNSDWKPQRLAVKEQAGDDSGSELWDWWIEQTRAEAQAFVPKDREYGDNSLVRMGETLKNAMGVGGNVSAKELAVWAYVVGKLERWTSAVSRGEEVSDDTLWDIATYIKMVQWERDQ